MLSHWPTAIPDACKFSIHAEYVAINLASIQLLALAYACIVNIPMHLQSDPQVLTELGLLTPAELESSIVSEFNPIRVGFHGGEVR